MLLRVYSLLKSWNGSSAKIRFDHRSTIICSETTPNYPSHSAPIDCRTTFATHVTLGSRFLCDKVTYCFHTQHAVYIAIIWFVTERLVGLRCDILPQYRSLLLKLNFEPSLLSRRNRPSRLNIIMAVSNYLQHQGKRKEFIIYLDIFFMSFKFDGIFRINEEVKYRLWNFFRYYRQLYNLSTRYKQIFYLPIFNDVISRT